MSGARVAVHDRSAEAEARAVAEHIIRAGGAGMGPGAAATGAAEECAGAVLLLCSPPMSSSVTGQVMEVNGGLLMP